MRVVTSFEAPLGVYGHLTRPKESEPAAEPLYHTFRLFSSGCWEKALRVAASEEIGEI